MIVEPVSNFQLRLQYKSYYFHGKSICLVYHFLKIVSAKQGSIKYHFLWLELGLNPDLPDQDEHYSLGQ